MQTISITLNEQRNVTLIGYLQPNEGEYSAMSVKPRPAMIVLPGGGYHSLSDREADPVALAYSRAGYQTFILRYTLRDKGAWPCQLQDYEDAMETIRANAEKWCVDVNKISVVGFSAGGHLAACAATIAKNKPAAALLIYPVILKEIADLCQKDLPLPNELVSPTTCPCFLAAVRDDQTTLVDNTLMMCLALAKNGIPFESHIYSFGDHGFSTAEPYLLLKPTCKRTHNWVDDSLSWLNEQLGNF